jgi:Fe-S cluster assembly scaffold protein SufB
MHAIPELKGMVDGVELSHDGRGRQDSAGRILYLMSRGMT